MRLIDAIPVRELNVELFYPGRFDAINNGGVHCKTCPHTIIAQAIQGRYEISCGDGRRADLAEGEAFLTGADLPLRIVHHGDARNGFRMRARWLHFHFTLFGAIDVTSLLDLPLGVSAKDCKPFGAIIEEELAARKAEDAALGSLARRQELAFQTLRLLCELAPMREDAMELLRQKDRLGPVLTFMREHVSRKLTVADIARVASLSVPRFHAFFRQFMGRSPMEHLKHLRLSEACRLLATGDEPLRVVAEKTGFCNEFHLSRDFKRVFGKPPGVWRRDYDRNLA
ncbi:MAG: hypothetical protein A3K19_14890 [Lentisphaerae bacterium RIFOXYB12_FULL_65_16]|nr:MAG: hypothetical protein A3K18_27450 [Lentisphaerae bacterium RIFOXYA12_64_32]OGV85910.1 MAG: hypothetical protein A3K19_14890 [Lentisphaerae bacterium RIFOXYB12_FULL_65_16]